MRSDEVLVKTSISAISPGTELLVYRGEAPEGLPADEYLAALDSTLEFPLKYGYAAIGEVIKAGVGVDPGWLGKWVFSFQPHQSQFTCRPADLLLLPIGLDPEDAVLLPNMETAVNFLMDGQPLLGEHVAVFGQGIVGLLTTALLSRMALGRLVTFDCYSRRRRLSLDLGAHLSLDPTTPDWKDFITAQSPGENPPADGTDLTYELSGSPTALDQALAVTGFAGRVVVGSWYGRKRVNLDLGGSFHRSRIRLLASQVSTLDPQWNGRWDKARRLRVAWEMIHQIKPSRLITHRLPLVEAADAYSLLDKTPEVAVQVILLHPS
jgi:2-desacetyl-2-hydroxyethyl bacteriochlorophyllide A dehydrogenase